MDALLRLFERTFGRPPARIAPLAADGSRRRMVRLVGTEGRTAVGVTGPDRDENRAFLAFSRTFRGLGLPVPLVHGADEASGVYLVEDLGDTTLFRALLEARRREPGPFPASMLPVYRDVLSMLPRFQVLGGRAIDFSLGYPRAAFDRPSMWWDLNYFKYHFLKLADIPFHEARLEDDYERLVTFLLASDGRHFLYRDFQSRNVMLRPGPGGGAAPVAPWFIDYQGGRRGALPYDVASLLYDAKAEIPPAVRDDLLDHYLGALAEHLPVDPDRFREEYRGFVLIRILQAMGAYGYRGFYERKAHFLQSVPPAVRNVEHILTSGPLPVEMPELSAVFERICASERLARGAAREEERGLTVHVGSFSYRSGVPVDPGGHGGGFVFDCRALQNPGLDPRHASRTGRDEEVAALLAADPAVADFFRHAHALVAAQVRAYGARGFTSLHVQFGCTGGQHRSVYLAERLAESLAGEFPDVRVRLDHAERPRWPEPARG